MAGVELRGTSGEPPEAAHSGGSLRSTPANHSLLITRTLLNLYILSVAFPALAASPFGDGFASGQLGDYIDGPFPSDRIQIVSLEGPNALRIADSRVRFKTTVVAPSAKYTLAFDGSIAGDVESIEENPRFAIFAQPRQKNAVLPYREIQFLDKAGSVTGQTLVFSMPVRDKHTYVDVFYTPPDAAALRLVIASGEGVTLTLQNLSLQATADEGAINVNPAFQYGPLNYSGWQNISAGGKLIEMDGKTVFDTKYGSRGTAFPLPGPGTYALSAKATGNGYNSCVKADIFDAEGKKLMTSVLRRYDKTNYFVAPPGAKSASFLVYSCLLEEVRLVRVGDESEIEKWLTK